MTRVNKRSGRVLATCLLSCLLPLSAADNQAENPAGGASAPAAQGSTDIEQLKQLLLDQQRQINELRQELSGQKAANTSGQAPEPAPASAPPNVGTVASLTPILSPTAAAALAIPINAPVFPQKTEKESRPPSTPNSANPCEAPPDGNAVPPYLRLGNVCIAPIGFMDITALWRDKNAGSGIGTSFGSIPYNNTTNAKNSEFRFSPQNSRIGFRIDGDYKGTHFIGYNEFDFLGTSGSTTLTVTNGAFVPRLRLFWVDARKGNIEFLAGQSWSLLTPNRNGLSALPGDLFYSQVIDVNYMAGLTWTRQPGMRVIFHGAGDKVAFGVSFENPDQYIGGSAGGSGITLPSALSALGSAQLDNGPNIGTASTVLSVPTVMPDIIAKLAFDPNSRFHVEVAGLFREFKLWNPNTTGPGAGQHFSTQGVGGSVNANFGITKNIRLVTNNFASDGGGRYLFGQAPDVIVRSNGSLSAVRADGTVDGIEAAFGKLLLYAYYGGIYIGRDSALDANGTTKIGYGYAGSANSMNRGISEYTFGFNHTIWRDARYGAINEMGQYEYVTRDPWYVALGAPRGTHDNTIMFNLRYTLPGITPRF